MRRLTGADGGDGGDESIGHITGGGPTTSPHLTGAASAAAAGARAVRAARATPQLIERGAGLRSPAKVGLRSSLSSAVEQPSSSAAVGLRSCLFCHPMPTLKIDRDTVLTAGISNTADFPLPTAHDLYPLPTSHYPLPTTHYPLLTTHYPLLSTTTLINEQVLTAGISNTADFAHQVHVAFSSLVSGSCI